MSNSYLIKLFKLSISLLFVGNSFAQPSYIEGTLPADDSVNVIISAESHAFMCPFLTPIFIDKLKSNGASKVVKNQDLRIHFTMSKVDFSDELIFRLAENVGYLRELIKIESVQ